MDAEPTVVSHIRSPARAGKETRHRGSTYCPRVRELVLGKPEPESHLKTLSPPWQLVQMWAGTWKKVIWETERLESVAEAG